MEESEQAYIDFREDFRESTTMSLKKLEIQNAVLEKEVANLTRFKSMLYRRIVVLCVALTISSGIIFHCSI